MKLKYLVFNDDGSLLCGGGSMNLQQLSVDGLEAVKDGQIHPDAFWTEEKVTSDVLQLVGGSDD